MNHEQIKSIVELAIQDKLLMPWWGLLIIVAASAFSAYLGSYIKTKAQNLATKEDFEEILSQVEKQVLATEEIKNEISHKFLKKQEWNKVLRGKLEDLVYCAHSLRQLAQSDVEKLGKNLDSELGSQFQSESDAILKVEMLSLLYFTELRVESLKLSLSFRLFQNEIMSSNVLAKKILDEEKQGVVSDISLDDFREVNQKIPRLHAEFTQCVNDLSSMARVVLDGLVEN